MDLHCGNCLDILPTIPTPVDLVFADLPYGTTQNEWDSIIPLDELWPLLLNVGHEKTVYVFTAAQPFASALVQSNLQMFKYEMIWKKTIGSGQLNISHQPLRNHENLLIFYQKRGIYNEQTTEGEAYAIERAGRERRSYGDQAKNRKVNDGFRHAKTVLKIPNPRIKGGHPTQKPEALVAHFIKCFTNPGSVVLDPVMGSGTTGAVCRDMGRQFIGIEKDEACFEAASSRLTAILEPERRAG